MTQNEILYLKQNEIKDSPCNMDEELVFLSYAHDRQDTMIVKEVFRRLYSRGYNVWIDAANMPHDENSWKTFADDALKGGKCRALILFRSEISLSKRTIKDEVQSFNEMDGSEHNTIAVDIYHEKGLHTRYLRDKEEFAEGTEARDNFEAICKIVNQSCNAFRFYDDCDEDYDVLASLISEELQSKGISPKFSLQDRIVEIMDGSFDVSLKGDQKEALFMFKSMLEKSLKDRKKRVLVVRGDPGTGKSVLCMKMLIEARSRNASVSVVSKNEAPRSAYQVVLDNAVKNAEDKDRKEILKRYRNEAKEIFKGSSSFIKYEKDTYDIIIIDESHRLIDRDQYVAKKEGCEYSQVGDMIKAGLVTVFFYDPRQIVSNADMGSVEEIIKWSRVYGVDRPEGIRLRTQCRCNGSNDYIDWLDSALGYEEDMGLFITRRSEYDLRVFDSPYEMLQHIKRLNESGDDSRLLSGYCWDWINDKNARNNTNVYDIKIPDKKAPGGEFRISWNLASDDSYAKTSTSVNESGSIHTVQGVEFQYVGVIIGPDMTYKNGELKTEPLSRASTDKTLKGLIGPIKNVEKERKKDSEYMPSNEEIMAKKRADLIIRNTYRILMTRGKLGCFIYCVDPDLQKYMKEKVAQFRAAERD